VNGFISRQAIHALNPMPQGGFSGNLLRPPAQAKMPPFPYPYYARTDRFCLFLMQRTQAILQYSLYHHFRMHGPTPSRFAHQDGDSIGSIGAFVIQNHQLISII
jgi:hypothetical protein